MNRTPLQKGNHPEPKTWRFTRQSDNSMSVGATCTDGHRIYLAGHAVNPRGQIANRVMCEDEECEFTEYVTLVGWADYNIQESLDPVNQLNTVELVPAHNRSAEIQEITDFPKIFTLIRTIILEEMERYQSDPFKAVPVVLTRLRYQAMQHKYLILGRYADLIIPSPDVDGLVNALAFVDANPNMFPTLTDKNYREGFDAGTHANPKIPFLA